MGEQEANSTQVQVQARFRAVPTASCAVAYEESLRGSAAGSRKRTWALRLILLFLLQAVAFALLPLRRPGVLHGLFTLAFSSIVVELSTAAKQAPTRVTIVRGPAAIAALFAFV
ncbi:hypothetical protein [Ramlibacter rhizophilus]|uniref:Uncharacterized protein n=1 Tax=Ramlibacter rhizophilus TaxID=1781167 RepID=A0A4Z0BKS6_9BURK|nr:hypothetical protein [Ramlibacter rhizophilus]TFY98704.1 hypothetical protein EZ242_14385 [Ramlibacter rhizophilus]